MLLTTRQKLRLAQVMGWSLRVARRLFGQSDSHCVARRSGLRWQLDLTEGIDLAIYLGVFERSTVRACTRLARPGDIVLDIGANIGAHTLLLANCVGPLGHVYAFEPTHYAYGKLNANLALNQDIRARVTAVQAMLSASDGRLLEPEIYSSWPLVEVGAVHELHRGALQSTAGARAVTLDTYLSEARIERVDLVKLDVDGFECDVLEGWTSLPRYRPRIIMELAPYVLAEHGRTLDQLLALLGRANYHLVSEDEVPLPLDMAGLEKMIPSGAGINVVAVPNPGLPQ